MNNNTIGLITGAVLALVTVTVVGCDESSDSKQQAQQEVILQQGTDAVGMPAITRFAERKELKQILEARDQEIATTTYYLDMMGHRHKLCDSIGYPLPYATQFTNPQKRVAAAYLLPQADPNGLFSPASADGTWVLCLNPETKKPAALYVEPKVVASPFALPDDTK